MVQHGVEEPREGRRVLFHRAGEVDDFMVGEEDAEQIACVLHPMRHAFHRQGLADEFTDRVGRGVEVGVQLLGALPQRRQSAGRGHRISRQCAGLIHPAQWREAGP